METSNEFEIENGTLTKYRGPGGHVTVPEGVTEIGEKAFFGCRELRRVSLPDVVTDIGSWAFFGCEQLAHIDLPQGVTRIRSRTFQYCWSLASLSLPKTVTSIEDEAFCGCYGLRQMELPPQVTAIGPRAFAHCLALKSVILPAGVKHIDAEAFAGCTALTAVTIPEGIASIGSNAFCGCASLKSVAVPDSVRELGRYAFADCTGLERAAVSDSVQAFHETFFGCTNLAVYVVSDRSRRYKAVDGVVFSKDGRKLIAFPPGKRCTRYDIPETVTEVCNGAFFEASAQMIFVPDTVKTFAKFAAKDTGERAPFVAHSVATLTADLGKPLYLGPVDDLPLRQRWRALDGFLFAWHIGLSEMTPWQESYLAYVRQEYAACEKKAWKDELALRLLMEYRLLKPDVAGNMLRKNVASGRADLAAALSTYLGLPPSADK